MDVGAFFGAILKFLGSIGMAIWSFLGEFVVAVSQHLDFNLFVVFTTMVLVVMNVFGNNQMFAMSTKMGGILVLMILVENHHLNGLWQAIGLSAAVCISLSLGYSRDMPVSQKLVSVLMSPALFFRFLVKTDNF